jgi:hypothetical protein
MLCNDDEVEEIVDACEGGAVAILGERPGAIGFEE